MRNLLWLYALGLSALAGCSSNQAGAVGGQGGSPSSTGGAAGSSATGGSLTGGAAVGAGEGGMGGASAGGGAGGGNAAGAGGAAPSDAAAAEAAGPACTLPTTRQTCAMSMLSKTTIIDFTTYAATGTWGVSTAGDLTGGTSPFQGPGVPELVHTVEGAAPDTSLHVTGSIPVNSYAGFVLWFGPCVDASKVIEMDGAQATTGMNFSIGGSLGGARFKFQVQSSEDYPVDMPNMKGACLFPTCDSRFTACVSPTVTLLTLPPTPTLTSFPWSGFVGGMPVATTTGAGVVGLQFQFECISSSSCAVDLRLGAIVLTL